MGGLSSQLRSCFVHFHRHDVRSPLLLIESLPPAIFFSFRNENPFVLRSRLKAAEQSVRPLQKQVEKLEKDNAKLQQRHVTFKSEIQKLHDRVAALEDRILTRLDQLGQSMHSAKVPRLVMTGPHTACVEIFTGQRFFVDTADRTVGLPIAFDGRWEPYLVTLFLNELREDSIFIDVGANCGFFSVVAATKIKSGRIFAVEPNPHLCELINKSLYVNAIWPYAKCLNLAVTDKDGEVTLNFDPELVGGGGLHHPAEIDPNISDHPPMTVQSVTVQAKTLDSIAAGQKLSRVDFIKIDVEGWEPHVFQGMNRTIAGNPQLKILLEFSHGAYADAPAFFKELKKAFATVSQVMPDGSMIALQDYDQYLKSLWAPWGNLFCRNA